MPDLNDYDKVHDLKGNFMMSSFIDSHSHFISLAFSFLQVNLEGCTSYGDIAERINDFKSENEIRQGEWITAKGYDHNSLIEKKHPRKHDLDAMSASNPLVIHHQSGHMGTFNSSALEKLGIFNDHSCPPGGKMETINGELTGYMEENAFIENIKKVPMPEATQIQKGVIRARDMYNKYGITVVQEGMMVKTLAPIYDLIYEIPDLGLNIIFYSSLEDLDYFMYDYEPKSIPDGSVIKFGGLKLFLDGSPQGRTAWTREPYIKVDEKDDPEYCGFGTMKDEDLEHALRIADDREIQVLIHCNGDRALEQLLNAAQKLKNEGRDISRLRPVIIHAQLIGTDQLDRVKELGFLISYFAAHVYHWGDIHIKNLGKERASRISPLNSTLSKNILFTMHQDSPVIKPDMAETLQVAMQRKTRTGLSIGSDEAIKLEDAIRALTCNCAYQYFEEDIRGSIGKGKKADFVIIEEDPFICRADRISTVKIIGLIKDGNFKALN